jgi:hypothetical protein
MSSPFDSLGAELAEYFRYTSGDKGIPGEVSFTSVRTNSASVTEVATQLFIAPLSLREAAASNGVYTTGDLKIVLVPAELSFALKTRDTATWNGDTYTILSIERFEVADLSVLTCRNLILANDLRQTGTLNRPTNAQDAAGRPTLASYTTVAADIPCRVQPMGGTAGDVLDRRTIANRYTAYLGQQVEARAKDKFVVGGVTYTVLEWKNPERIAELPSLTLEKVP